MEDARVDKTCVHLQTTKIPFRTNLVQEIWFTWRIFVLKIALVCVDWGFGKAQVFVSHYTRKDL